MGNYSAEVSLTFNYGRFRFESGGIYGGPNVKIILLIMSEEGTGKLVCIPPILVGASLKAGATFLMRRIPEPCN